MIHRSTGRRSNVLLLLHTLVLILLIGNNASAQQDLATIQGSVTDQTGAFVAGATVTRPLRSVERRTHRDHERRRHLHRPATPSRHLRRHRRADRLR